MTNSLSATMLLDPTVIEDPYPFYRRLHAEAPVWNVPSTDLFTVSTFDLLAEASNRVEDFSSNINCLIYRDPDGTPQRFTYGDAGAAALATADPPMHTLHRSTVFPELVAKRMATLEPDVVAIAHTCIDQVFKDRAGERGSCEFIEAIANVVPITIISRLIGFPDGNIEQLLQAAFDSTAMIGATLDYDTLIEYVGRTSEIQTWIAGQLAAAVDAPGQDLLGGVARGVSDGVFTDFEATVVLHTLLSAGGESTTSLLGNAVRILAEDQHLQQRLRADPELITPFVEEALRLESPFRFMMRSVPNDTALGGINIPADSTVLLLWGAGNRDATEFERPDAINLERRIPKHHVTFGRGIHHCVGAPLARVEAHNVLAVLLERTTSFTLNGEPRWLNSLLVRRHEHLPLQLTQR